MSRFTNNEGTITTNIFEERLKRVEQQIQSIVDSLSTTFLLGRLRVDRTAPVDSNDVNALDALYDIVRDENYEYILINNSGTLNWVRIIMATF